MSDYHTIGHFVRVSLLGLCIGALFGLLLAFLKLRLYVELLS